jgi:hypothetical protein
MLFATGSSVAYLLLASGWCVTYNISPVTFLTFGDVLLENSALFHFFVYLLSAVSYSTNTAHYIVT